MNIKQAKEQIEKTVKIYLQKNDLGEYVIPFKKQRPIFISGAPGIGKTAIMEQIAQDMDIGIISYSMTHHTRQSAIGLPYITEKNFSGEITHISEYSMSEIVGSVYKLIEETEKNEGILFLDEINCVSETLAPTMLQFLQMKRFGMHDLPPGWVIVTAGNPAQYNRSVKEFDIATLDRLKVIHVDPDYECWREYALSELIHASIVSYLDMKKTDFYRIDTRSGQKTYVTARGWEDLSTIIYCYEKNGFIVDESLILQYLSDKDIASDYAIYYDLYNKYKAEYDVDSILDGEINQDIKEKASIANFDARMSLLSIMMNLIHVDVNEYLEMEDMLKKLREILLEIKAESRKIDVVISEKLGILNKEMNRRILSHSISENGRRCSKLILIYLKEMYKMSKYTDNFDEIKGVYNAKVDKLVYKKNKIKSKLNNLFTFIEECWGVGKEIIVLVNDLTININTAKFISENGCEKYFTYNNNIMLTERKECLMNQVLDSVLF